MTAAASSVSQPLLSPAVRIAFVGKGGSGKSVIAGTVARLLARAGYNVLAVDSDPMPGLSYSIGVDVTDAGIPDEAVEETPEAQQGPRYRLRAGLDATTAVERYAAFGPDGVRVLQFGKLRGHAGELRRSQFAFRQVLSELPQDRWSLVGDLPGGTRQPFFGWAGYASTVLVVVEPTAKSMLSARRLARMALAEQAPERIVAVANKVRHDEDADLVRARTGLDVVAAIPADEAVADADRRGEPPLDHAPGSPAVQAVQSLMDWLRKDLA